MSKVARSLPFAPHLEQLAARIVANITGDGRAQFNGAHLRMEKDAKDWSVIMGGEEVQFPRNNIFLHGHACLAGTQLSPVHHLVPQCDLT